MQETVTFDPRFVDRAIPLHSRLFAFFVLFVVVFFVVRSLQLAWNLWLSSLRSRFAPKNSAKADADSVARAALVGRPPESELPFDANDDAMRRRPAFLSILAESEIRCEYLFATCLANVRSLRKLAVLTLMISVLEMTLGLANILVDIATSKSTGVGAISGGLSESVKPFAVGLFLCAVLYAAYAFYEGVLHRRKAKWQYHCSTFRSRVSEPVAAAIPD